jgi:diaminopimelate epimerase
MLNFTKAVASGNDFIIIDVKSGTYGDEISDYGALARDLCRRNISIGADGILVLEDSENADFRMRIINPDGSEVDMCGNGARCSAFYASKKGWGSTLAFETGAGIIEATVKTDSVALKMSDPLDIKLEFDMELDAGSITVNSLNSGVPHVVQVVDDIENYSVKDIGRKIREHALFAPAGTNANFVGKINDNSAVIRTYERGVEDETLACGTGSVATAIVLGLLGMVESPVNLLTRSGEILKISFKSIGQEVTDVYLEGSAKIVYEGKV